MSKGCTKVPVIKSGQGFMDYIVSRLVLRTLPFWKSVGATPNFLTGLGFLSSLACIYTMSEGSYLCVFFFLLRSYFDYADGQFARTYGPITRFGDYFDHISDVICWGGILVLLWCKYELAGGELIFLLTILLIMCGQLGCLEKECGECCDQNGFLATFGSPLCTPLVAKLGKVFDNATVMILLSFLVVKKIHEYHTL